MARSIAVLDSAILALIHKVLAPRTCPKMKNNCAAATVATVARVVAVAAEKNYEKFINVKVCTASQMGAGESWGGAWGGRGGSTRKETSNNVNYMPVAAAAARGVGGSGECGPRGGGAKFPLSGADKAGQELTTYICSTCTYMQRVCVCVCVLYTHAAALPAAHLPQTAQPQAAKL